MKTGMLRKIMNDTNMAGGIIGSFRPSEGMFPTTPHTGFTKSLLTPKLMPVKRMRTIAFLLIDRNHIALFSLPHFFPISCKRTRVTIPEAPIAMVRGCAVPIFAKISGPC